MLDEQDILVSDEILDDPGHVQHVLAHRVEEVLHRAEDIDGERRIVRLIVPMAPLDAPAWLAAQTLLPKNILARAPGQHGDGGGRRGGPVHGRPGRRIRCASRAT